MQQHGFDLQREITQPASTPDNVHFLRDNNGPYVKIYYSDNKEYELFDHRNNMDMFNNYLPNTQNQMPFQPMMMNQAAQNHVSNANKNSNSVIHHLVTSNLGPGKFEFGIANSNNSSNNNNSNINSTNNIMPITSPLNIAIPTLLDHHAKSPSSYNSNNINKNNIPDENCDRASTNSSPILNSSTTSATSVINNSNNPHHNNTNNSSNKKQRIVAEVKPMRMSYSDVLSKNASQQPVTPSIGQTNSASSSPNTTMPIINNNNNNNNKASKTKYTPSNSFEKKQQENAEKNRKSPTNPIIINNATNNEANKKNQPITVKAEKPPATQQSNQLTGVKTSNSSSINSGNNNGRKKQQAKDSANTKTARNDQMNKSLENKSYTTDSDNNEEEEDDEEENSSMIDSDNDDENDNNTTKSDYYDIRKNIYQGEHHKVEKIKTAGYKKNINSKQATTKRTEKSQKRMSGKISGRKQKHEFLQKIFASCIEYLCIFIKWLWLLIYDVSYLSFGIIWDRLGWIYHCLLQGVSYVRRELSGNPGKVLIVWIKNHWKRFDSKFDKKSKWAFWRWIFKKQSNSENSKDYYKDGKLPKTAEEAMKSLLNCKEKDAYR